MESIKDDIKAIRKDLSEINVTMAVNTASLENHMARTEITERRLEKLEYVLIGLFAAAVLGGIVKLLIS
jgi:hypothetical protein